MRRRLVAGLLILLSLVVGIVVGRSDRAWANGGISLSVLDTDTIWFARGVTLDASGYPVINYTTGTPTSLRIIHCNDANCAGGDDLYETISSSSIGGASSVALDSSGNPVVMYDTGFPIRVVHCNDPNCSGNNESNVAPNSGAIGIEISFTLDGSGYPVAAVYRPFGFGTGELRLLHCNDPDCAGDDESYTTVDSGGDVGGDPSLVLDASGNPVIAEHDLSNEDLKLVHCNDPDCAGGDESVTSPATANVTGRNPSLVLDLAGYPVVVYREQTGDSLWLMHCNDADCAGSDETITPIDFAIFDAPKLALDSSGNPVVAYERNIIGYPLKVVHCNDPDCADGDEAEQVVDPSYGGSPNLVLDASGRPAIAYVEWTQDDLKLIHCGTVNCDVSDFDGDGCPDMSEQGLDPTQGGQRDPKNPWDYFNPSLDGINRTDDVTLEVMRYGHDDNGDPMYNTRYDRTALMGGNPWQFGPPDGLIRTADISAAVRSYGHDCGPFS